MDLLATFIAHVKNKQWFSFNDQLLLAVSGGLDSVVLCELCRKAGLPFSIAHCNFQLRGAESERDEQFVQQLADHYSVVLHSIKFDTARFAEEQHLSTQVAARQLRYNWFKQLIAEGKARWILTAHHADDNIETVLMHFFKGTGIAGLKGIPEKNDLVIRPLLPFRKSDLTAFAEQAQLKWVEDSSNFSDKYDRNYFRRHIIPLVNKLYPQVEDNLTNNIDRFVEIDQVYQQAILQTKKKLIEQKGEEYFIPVLKLAKQVPLNTIVYEVFKSFNFSPAQTPEIIKLFEADSGKWIQSHTHRIVRHRKWLLVSPLQEKTNTTHLIEKAGDNVLTDQFQLSVELNEWKNEGFSNSLETAELDAAKIRFPLILRKPRAGDYFYPLGMKKKKKISRFLIDQKLSKSAKEDCWLIESNKRIVWVVGKRIDDRFKITPQTKSALTIRRKNR